MNRSNMKTELRERGMEGMGGDNLLQDRDTWRAF
jgi:hypothetical protein